MSERATKRPVGSHERRKLKEDVEVPVNLERVLLEAAQDEAFYQMLVADNARALAEKGYHLRVSEQAMLSAMPRDALYKMVERLRPDKLKRSNFAKYVVTALAGSMIITASSACGGEESDWPEGETTDGAVDSSDGTGGPFYNGGSGGGKATAGKGGGGTTVGRSGDGGRAGTGKGGGGGSAGDKGVDSGI